MADRYIKNTEGSVLGGPEYHILNTLEILLRIATRDMDDQERLHYKVAVEFVDGGKFGDTAIEYVKEGKVLWMFIDFKSSSSLHPVIHESKFVGPQKLWIEDEFNFSLFYWSAVRTFNIKKYAVTNFVIHTNRRLDGDLDPYFEEDPNDRDNKLMLTNGRGKYYRLKKHLAHDHHVQLKRRINLHIANEVIKRMDRELQNASNGRCYIRRYDQDWILSNMNNPHQTLTINYLVNLFPESLFQGYLSKAKIQEFVEEQVYVVSGDEDFANFHTLRWYATFGEKFRFATEQFVAERLKNKIDVLLTDLCPTPKDGRTVRLMHTGLAHSIFEWINEREANSKMKDVAWLREKLALFSDIRFAR